MPRLTKDELKEVAGMKPMARDVSQYVWLVEVITINHFDVDEIVVKFDDETPAKYRIQTESGNGGEIDTDYERQYFTAKGRRWYLDHIVRYDSPWMGGRA